MIAKTPLPLTQEESRLIENWRSLPAQVKRSFAALAEQAARQVEKLRAKDNEPSTPRGE